MNPLHPVVLAVRARYAEAFDPFLVWLDHELGTVHAEASPLARLAREDHAHDVGDAHGAAGEAGCACAASGRVGVVVGGAGNQSEVAHV